MHHEISPEELEAIRYDVSVKVEEEKLQHKEEAIYKKHLDTETTINNIIEKFLNRIYTAFTTEFFSQIIEDIRRETYLDRIDLENIEESLSFVQNIDTVEYDRLVEELSQQFLNEYANIGKEFYSQLKRTLIENVESLKDRLKKV